MEKKFLLLKLENTAQPFITNKEQIKKAKSNLILIAVVLTLCMLIRLANDPGFTKGKETYFNISSDQTVSNFNVSRIA